MLAAALGVASAVSTDAAFDVEFYLPSETLQWRDYYSPLGKNRCVLVLAVGVQTAHCTALSPRPVLM